MNFFYTCILLSTTLAAANPIPSSNMARSPAPQPAKLFKRFDCGGNKCSLGNAQDAINELRGRGECQTRNSGEQYIRFSGCVITGNIVGYDTQTVSCYDIASAAQSVLDGGCIQDLGDRGQYVAGTAQVAVNDRIYVSVHS